MFFRDTTPSLGRLALYFSHLPAEHRAKLRTRIGVGACTAFETGGNKTDDIGRNWQGFREGPLNGVVTLLFPFSIFNSPPAVRGRARRQARTRLLSVVGERVAHRCHTFPFVTGNCGGSNYKTCLWQTTKTRYVHTSILHVLPSLQLQKHFLPYSLHSE